MKLLKLTYIQYFLYTLLSLIAFVFILKVSKAVLAPLVLATLISVALYPILTWIQKLIKSKLLSVSLLVFFLFALFVGFLYLITKQFDSFYEDYPNISEKLMDLVHKLEASTRDLFAMKSFNVVKIAKENSAEILSMRPKNSLSSAFKSLTGLFTYFVFIPLYIFLILYYKSAIKRVVIMVLEMIAVKSSIVIQELSGLVQNYLKGMFTVMLILGTVNSLGLFLLDVPYAFLLGFMVAAFGIVPYVGIIVGSFLVLLVSYLSQGDYLTLLYITILFAVVQFVEGNFLTPKIVGNKVNLNPLVAIIALLIGDQIWGIVGMILALPITSIILMVSDHIKARAFYKRDDKI